VGTIRLPAIGISAMTIVLAYLMAREIVGRWGLVLVVVMATCPTFIFMSKVDLGPIAVAMFLTMTVLLAFFRYLHGGGIRWLAAFLAACLLGIFDKQNFSWLLIGVAVAAAIVYHRPLWRTIRRRLVATLVTFGALIAVAVPLVWSIVLPNLSAGGSSSLQDPLTHLASTSALFARTIGYSEMVNFFTGRVAGQPGWMDWMTIAAVVALMLLGIRRLVGPLPEAAAVPAQAACFFAILFAVMFVEVAATKQAMWAWHVIELLPYPVLVGLCSTLAVVRSGITLKKSIVAVATIGLLGTLVVQGVATAQFVSVMRNPSQVRAVFSTDVYRDAAFLNANSAGVNEIVTSGWGPGTPIFALACPDERLKYFDDLWPHVLVGVTAKSAPGVVQELFGNERILLVSVSDPARVGIPTSLTANVALLEQGYAEAFPGRHAQRVLSTDAYNITYFGPGTFHPAHRSC
jgi:4-amino-4-deoxy-L-arabinose transferase-like glycosyltransferase